MCEEHSEDLREEYSEEKFRDKLKRYAKAAGREVVRPAIILYHVAKSDDTPSEIKLSIYGVLAYFIMPVDSVPDFTPVVGYVDDLGALAAVTMMAAAHVTPEIEENADKNLKDLGFQD